MKISTDDKRTLLKAAALIRERGLAKFVTRDAKGRLCAMGAINVALTGSDRYPGNNEPERLARIVTAANGIEPNRTRPDWQYAQGLADFANRGDATAEDVASAFEAAAMGGAS